MKKCLIFLILSVILLSACTPAATPTVAGETAPTQTTSVTLKVFAPSTMTEAAKALGAAFEAANPGVTVTFEIGHSPTQRLQFTQGATGDVFITAAKKDMDDAITDQSIESGKEALIARNKLVVILPPNNPAGIETLEDLVKDGVKLLVANAETPIGKVTLTVLDKLAGKFGEDYKAKFTANVVSQEAGVKPIVSKIKLSEADAGIVFISDLAAATELKSIEIPAELNVISQLYAAPLAKATNPEQAAAFAAFVASPEGQAILQKWGFLAPKE